MKKLYYFLLLFVLSACASLMPSMYPESDHRDKDGFFNPHLKEVMEEMDLVEWIRIMSTFENGAKEEHYVPGVVEPDLSRIYNPPSDRIQVTWIGHATFLVQMAGINILTDPIFSDRASPVPGLGPKRYAPPGIAMKDLPPVDAVVISHGHYDHLDLNTIRSLGDKPLYLVPLGLKSWFRDKGFSHAREYDWWESFDFEGVKFTLVPTQHMANRGLSDINKTLWGGWAIADAEHRVYFTGDTGYSPQFKEIGERAGPFDVSLIPVGAYAPRKLLEHVHVTPEEAVRIHKDVKSEHSIAMHWGTFKLTAEPMGEPVRLLREALKEQQVSPEKFITMKIGETRSF